jgi:hypothetical protein
MGCPAACRPPVPVHWCPAADEDHGAAPARTRSPRRRPARQPSRSGGGWRGLSRRKASAGRDAPVRSGGGAVHLPGAGGSARWRPVLAARRASRAVGRSWGVGGSRRWGETTNINLAAGLLGQQMWVARGKICWANKYR